MPIILDGNHVASEIKSSIASAVKRTGAHPKLAVVIVGNDPASQIYIRNIQRDCNKCGFQSETYALSQDISEVDLLKKSIS